MVVPVIRWEPGYAHALRWNFEEHLRQRYISIIRYRNTELSRETQNLRFFHTPPASQKFAFPKKKSLTVCEGPFSTAFRQNAWKDSPKQTIAWLWRVRWKWSDPLPVGFFPSGNISIFPDRSIRFPDDGGYPPVWRNMLVCQKWIAPTLG